MHQETLRVFHLWKLAEQETEESREQLKHSLAKLAKLQEKLNTLLLYEEQQIPHYYTQGPEPIDETTYQQNYSYNNFSDDSPSPFSSASPLEFASNLTSPEIHDSDCYSLRSNQMGYVVENRRDFETVVLENIGGVLPEKGKFSQAVKNAGQLLESLFITGPVPKWRNPPFQRPVLSNNIGKWISGGLELGPENILNRSFSGKMPRFSLMP
ncbi:hypothetical protein V5N11_029605 [Cardamine amara subsp. amara]|uniref:Uncharacterized protein n=1 Tax=Cardamine amara subsp. amara TaxID=228776 RepID=A0ABD1AND0_CARAN